VGLCKIGPPLSSTYGEGNWPVGDGFVGVAAVLSRLMTILRSFARVIGDKYFISFTTYAYRYTRDIQTGIRTSTLTYTCSNTRAGNNVHACTHMYN
jgi:hypothetical protein